MTWPRELWNWEAAAASLQQQGPQDQQQHKALTQITLEAPDDLKMDQSVILVGAPGVGKSTILNALGENFRTGYKTLLTTTQQLDEQQVIRHNRRNVRLVDLPSVDFREGLDANFLPKIQPWLLSHDNNNESQRQQQQCEVFFIITANSGRFNVGDLSMISLVLKNIKPKTPVGLIFTMVNPKYVNTFQDSEQAGRVVSLLREQGVDINPQSVLALPIHDVGFSENDKQRIQDYIFPTQSILVKDPTASTTLSTLSVPINDPPPYTQTLSIPMDGPTQPSTTLPTLSFPSNGPTSYTQTLSIPMHGPSPPATQFIVPVEGPTSPSTQSVDPVEDPKTPSTHSIPVNVPTRKRDKIGRLLVKMFCS